MNEQLVADRAHLQTLLSLTPHLSNRQMAKECQHTLNWVRKWKPRLQTGAPTDQTVLWGKSCKPHHCRLPQPPLVEERVLHYRTQLSETLGRIAGAKTILYHLTQDQELKHAGITPPRSATTIWKILVKHGCIARPGVPAHKPLPRSAPFEIIAIDFKDVTSVEVEPDGKKQHLVEVMNFIDEGTSFLWEAVARPDFTAETVIATLFEVFELRGVPNNLRFDRDVRFVGAAQGRDFPSAMVRMLHVLGVGVNICPPHRPDKNPFRGALPQELRGGVCRASPPKHFSRNSGGHGRV